VCSVKLYRGVKTFTVIANLSYNILNYLNIQRIPEVV